MNRLEDDIRTVLRSQADAMQVPEPQFGSTTMTLIDNESDRTQTEIRPRWPIVAVAAAAIVAIVAGGLVIATRDDADDPQLTGAAPGPTGPDGLVTEEVEPGVERIIRDDVGHDLDEGHPTNRYDMDDVAVTPDGTVWLSTSYSGSDNDADSHQAFLWALGQPGTTRMPDFFCWTEGVGVGCTNDEAGQTTYLAGTPITAVTIAPDGTVWAVGGYDGENGGLYRITHD